VPVGSGTAVRAFLVSRSVELLKKQLDTMSCSETAKPFLLKGVRKNYFNHCLTNVSLLVKRYWQTSARGCL